MDVKSVIFWNGYLSYTRTRTGDTRYNPGKELEIKLRKNM